jgi:hypothetical protein
MAYLFPRAVQFHAGFGPEWECTARAQGEPTCAMRRENAKSYLES